jgi:hypothetical protein
MKNKISCPLNPRSASLSVAKGKCKREARIRKQPVAGSIATVPEQFKQVCINTYFLLCNAGLKKESRN